MKLIKSQEKEKCYTTENKGMVFTRNLWNEKQLERGFRQKQQN